MPKTERLPAPIVKCPHCNHKGSSRGLFTHIRLAHPNIESRPPKSVKTHPYAIKESSIGSIDVKPIKRKKKRASVSGFTETEEALIAIFLPILADFTIKWLTEKGLLTFQSEGLKTKQSVYNGVPMAQ